MSLGTPARASGRVFFSFYYRRSVCKNITNARY
jgi:hypothetical protein